VNLALLGLIAGAGIFAVAKTGVLSSGDQGDPVTPDSAPDPEQGDQPNVTPWTRFDDLFHKWGSVYNVDWTWLKAFCLNESNLGRAKSVALGLANPGDVDGSKSSDGKSWGIMQVTLTTGAQYDSACSPQKLNDPDYSVQIAAELIADNTREFSQTDPRFTEWVVKSYNQGAGNTKKELNGTGGGFADAYWDRWQRNLTQVEENPT
jgi:hypothetical protein